VGREGTWQPPRSAISSTVYLYVGTADFERDLADYRYTLGAPVVWSFSRLGAKVAALRLGGSAPQPRGHRLDRLPGLTSSPRRRPRS